MPKQNIEVLDMFKITDLERSDYEYCNHCNGYGSSLKEEAETCTKCKGTGLQTKEE